METTLNIHIDILRKITLAAGSLGISRSELITLLIKKMMDDVTDPGRLGSMVRYQERNSPDSWRIFHLQVRFDDYEYFLDLRKLLKMSVSLILAYAVINYLNTFNKNKTDNYPFKNYVIMKEVIDNVICWKFIWGYPIKIRQFLPKRHP
ncbi:MAG: hypothetical protein KA369_13230 [Spirochaetes bacterium]|nr:hypothetical protein [Spirochaetota bacterium]